jgi:hypothetical protein
MVKVGDTCRLVKLPNEARMNILLTFKHGIFDSTQTSDVTIILLTFLS